MPMLVVITMRRPASSIGSFILSMMRWAMLPRFFAVTQADEDAELVAAETRDHVFMAAHRAFDMAGDAP